jgi:flagellar assembly factor FliW
VNITTLQFGEITIDEKEVFVFPQGLPGFEGHPSYIFLQHEPESPFVLMQSVEDPDIAMVLTKPFVFFPDYDFELSEGILKEMEIESAEDVAVWSTVSVRGGLKEATLNLLAPIIVNVKNRRGKQIILHGSSYNTKHKLAYSESSESE